MILNVDTEQYESPFMLSRLVVYGKIPLSLKQVDFNEWKLPSLLLCLRLVFGLKLKQLLLSGRLYEGKKEKTNYVTNFIIHYLETYKTAIVLLIDFGY